MKRAALAKACRLAAGLFLSSAATFPAIPEGYETYEGHKDQFTIALPVGWTTYDQEASLTDRRSSIGVVVFSARPVTEEGQTTADENLLSQVDTGEMPSFFVDRQPASKGMSCAKFSRNSAYGIGIQLAQDPIFGFVRRMFSATPLKHDKIDVGGCQGLRFRGRGKKGAWRLAVLAVSDGRVLYLFSLRNEAGNFAKNIDIFDEAIATLQLANRE